VEAQPMERPGEEVGVDLGLECFAALSDGTRKENPRYYRGSERRLARRARARASSRGIFYILPHPSAGYNT